MIHPYTGLLLGTKKGSNIAQSHLYVILEKAKQILVSRGKRREWLPTKEKYEGIF